MQMDCFQIQCVDMHICSFLLVSISVSIFKSHHISETCKAFTIPDHAVACQLDCRTMDDDDEKHMKWTRYGPNPVEQSAIPKLNNNLVIRFVALNYDVLIIRQ